MALQNELQALWDRYLDAYRSGDSHGCAAVFSSNALLTSPYGPPAHGRDAIEAIHREWTGDGSENKQLEMTEFGASGDLAWCLAKFSEGAETDSGVSLSVLERQSDGQWLIRICSLNGDD